ncbi:MAG: hypothetical protein S4CHLAM20_09970 [Chlamydiia bacterium]|nr:hypothetical protein [Chlamydiia bacterium]
MSVIYTSASLPILSFNSAPPISLKSFYDLLQLNLGKSAKEKIKSIRRVIDVKNILSFQTGIGFDVKGNFLESGLRLALSNCEYLPDYIFEFLDQYVDEVEMIKNFPRLYAMFFEEEIAKGGIIAEFLTFEKNVNLLLFGFNAKKHSFDVESYLQYEDLTDPIVTQVALQCKNSGPFIFPFEYKLLEEKILDSGADPMKQYLAVASYRFNFYKEIVDNSSGSFRSICAYMMCLWILDEKSSLDEIKGRKILTELVESDHG